MGNTPSTVEVAEAATNSPTEVNASLAVSPTSAEVPSDEVWSKLSGTESRPIVILDDDIELESVVEQQLENVVPLSFDAVSSSSRVMTPPRMRSGFQPYYNDSTMAVVFSPVSQRSDTDDRSANTDLAHGVLSPRESPLSISSRQRNLRRNNDISSRSVGDVTESSRLGLGRSQSLRTPSLEPSMAIWSSPDANNHYPRPQHSYGASLLDTNCSSDREDTENSEDNDDDDDDNYDDDNNNDEPDAFEDDTTLSGVCASAAENEEKEVEAEEAETTATSVEQRGDMVLPASIYLAADHENQEVAGGTTTTTATSVERRRRQQDVASPTITVDKTFGSAEAVQKPKRLPPPPPLTELRVSQLEADETTAASSRGNRSTTIALMPQMVDEASAASSRANRSTTRALMPEIPQAKVDEASAASSRANRSTTRALMPQIPQLMVDEASAASSRANLPTTITVTPEIPQLMVDEVSAASTRANRSTTRTVTPQIPQLKVEEASAASSRANRSTTRALMPEIPQVKVEEASAASSRANRSTTRAATPQIPQLKVEDASAASSRANHSTTRTATPEIPQLKVEEASAASSRANRSTRAATPQIPQLKIDEASAASSRANRSTTRAAAPQIPQLKVDEASAASSSRANRSTTRVADDGVQGHGQNMAEDDDDDVPSLVDEPLTEMDHPEQRVASRDQLVWASPGAENLCSPCTPTIVTGPNVLCKPEEDDQNDRVSDIQGYMHEQMDMGYTREQMMNDEEDREDSNAKHQQSLDPFGEHFVVDDGERRQDVERARVTSHDEHEINKSLSLKVQEKLFCAPTEGSAAATKIRITHEAGDAKSVLLSAARTQAEPGQQTVDNMVDMKFIRKYEEFFDAFCWQYPDLMARNPQLLENLKVAKLQKLLEVSVDAEATLRQELESLRKSTQIKEYREKLVVTSRHNAELESTLQDELDQIQQESSILEGRLIWQAMTMFNGRAKKQQWLLKQLFDSESDSDDILSSLPDGPSTQPIRDAVAESYPSTELPAEGRQEELRQLQVENAFLNAEVQQLEKKLAELEAEAKQHAWVDSVFSRLNSKQMLQLREELKDKIGVQF